MPVPLPPNPDPILNLPITPELVKKHGLLPEELSLLMLRARQQESWPFAEAV